MVWQSKIGTAVIPMRLLLLLSSLLLVLAPAAADPDLAAETAIPSAATAIPPAATNSPPSGAARKVQTSPSAETAKPKADARKLQAEMRELSATHFKQCMQDWDAATHMTKREWERTCRRVVDNRVKFLLEQRDK